MQYLKISLISVPIGDGWNPSPLGEEKIINVAMRRYVLAAHTKSDLKVHLVWSPKYRKRVLVGPVAVRTRDILRQIAMEHELDIISRKVASDHIHMFIGYRPTHNISKIMQWLKGISSRVFCCGCLILKEHIITPVAALSDMMRQAGKYNS